MLWPPRKPKLARHFAGVRHKQNKIMVMLGQRSAKVRNGKENL